MYFKKFLVIQKNKWVNLASYRKFIREIFTLPKKDFFLNLV